MLPTAVVDIEFDETNNLRLNDLKELQELIFRKECQEFLQSVFKKIDEKSPIKFKIV